MRNWGSRKKRNAETATWIAPRAIRYSEAGKDNLARTRLLRSLNSSAVTVFKKTPILFIILAFLFNTAIPYDLAWAAKTDTMPSPIGNKVSVDPGLDSLLGPRDIRVSPAFGTVKERYQQDKDSKGLIVHIQDLHTHYEAHKNISSIIERLSNTHGINTVLCEAKDTGKGLAFLKPWALEKARVKVAEEYLKEGKLTGWEALDLTSDVDLTLQGIEDKGLYMQDMDRFLKAEVFRPDALKFLKVLQSVIGNLKTRMYSKPQRAFDEKMGFYRDEHIGITEYTEYLVKLAGKYKIDHTSLANLKILLDTIDLEKRINFKKAERERGDIIDVLAEKLEENDKKTLLDKAVEFQGNRISQNEFYRLILALINKTRIDMKKYPDFVTYTNYLATYQDLDASKLFEEINSLENNLAEALFKKDDRKKLFRISKDISILGGLVDFKLTPDEFDYYAHTKSAFNTGNWLKFLKLNSEHYKLSQRVPDDASIIEDNIPILEDFYKIARKRDEAFVKNIEKQFNTRNLRAAFLATGGFHTPGVTRRLKEAGYSYVVIAPRIESDMDYDKYHKVLKDAYKSLMEEAVIGRWHLSDIGSDVTALINDLNIALAFRYAETEEEIAQVQNRNRGLILLSDGTVLINPLLKGRPDVLANLLQKLVTSPQALAEIRKAQEERERPATGRTTTAADFETKLETAEHEELAIAAGVFLESMDWALQMTETEVTVDERGVIVVFERLRPIGHVDEAIEVVFYRDDRDPGNPKYNADVSITNAPATKETFSIGNPVEAAALAGLASTHIEENYMDSVSLTMRSQFLEREAEADAVFARTTTAAVTVNTVLDRMQGSMPHAKRTDENRALARRLSDFARAGNAAGENIALVNAVIESDTQPPALRKMAVVALSQMIPEPDEVSSRLVDLIGNPRTKGTEVSLGAAEAFSLVDESAAQAATPRLIELTSDQRWYVRAAAVRALGGMDDITQDMAAAIVRVAGDESKMARVQAIRALPRTGRPAPELYPVLLEAAKDELISLRLVSIAAIGELGTPTPEVYSAVDQIADKKYPDEPVKVINVAKGARRKWDIERAQNEGIPGLTKALDNRDETVQRFAVTQLGRRGDEAKEAVPGLLKLARDTEGGDWDIFFASLDALGNIGPAAQDAAPYLEQLTRGYGPSSQTHRTSKRALEKITSPTGRTATTQPILKTGETRDLGDGLKLTVDNIRETGSAHVTLLHEDSGDKSEDWLRENEFHLRLTNPSNEHIVTVRATRISFSRDEVSFEVDDRPQFPRFVAMPSPRTGRTATVAELADRVVAGLDIRRQRAADTTLDETADPEAVIRELIAYEKPTGDMRPTAGVRARLALQPEVLGLFDRAYINVKYNEGARQYVREMFESATSGRLETYARLILLRLLNLNPDITASGDQGGQSVIITYSDPAHVRTTRKIILTDNTGEGELSLGLALDRADGSKPREVTARSTEAFLQLVEGLLGTDREITQWIDLASSRAAEPTAEIGKPPTTGRTATADALARIRAAAQNREREDIAELERRFTAIESDIDGTTGRELRTSIEVLTLSANGEYSATFKARVAAIEGQLLSLEGLVASRLEAVDPGEDHLYGRTATAREAAQTQLAQTPAPLGARTSTLGSGDAYDARRRAIHTRIGTVSRTATVNGVTEIFAVDLEGNVIEESGVLAGPGEQGETRKGVPGVEEGAAELSDAAKAEIPRDRQEEQVTDIMTIAGLGRRRADAVRADVVGFINEHMAKVNRNAGIRLSVDTLVGTKDAAAAKAFIAEHEVEIAEYLSFIAGNLLEWKKYAGDIIVFDFEASEALVSGGVEKDVIDIWNGLATVKDGENIDLLKLERAGAKMKYADTQWTSIRDITSTENIENPLLAVAEVIPTADDTGMNWFDWELGLAGALLLAPASVYAEEIGASDLSDSIGKELQANSGVFNTFADTLARITKIQKSEINANMIGFLVSGYKDYREDPVQYFDLLKKMHKSGLIWKVLKPVSFDVIRDLYKALGEVLRSI